MNETAVNILFRETLHADDPEHIYHIAESCALFYLEELQVARELVQERLSRGEASGYYFIVAEDQGMPVGYTCFGPVPMTRNRFDLYWIAVMKSCQGTGIGRQLMQRTEARIQVMAGERIYVETSSRDDYAATHRFYHACQYRQEAVLQDYYAPGDDKVIYMKVL